MYRILGKKFKMTAGTEALLTFIQSWDIHGKDETSICAGTLDTVRAYLGERPCCIWKKVNSGVQKTCERGMVEIFFRSENKEHQAFLARVLLSGEPEYDDFSSKTAGPEIEMGWDGFLHVPIKSREDVIGVLSIGVHKKEPRNQSFVDPLACLGRLVGVALQEGKLKEASQVNEKQLRAEVDATTRELEQTNQRLIQRVKELKATFDELKGKVKELTQANRAKDEFLSVVSHELKTPLTSIKGFLRVLLDEDAGPISDNQKRFLGIANSSADRLNLLISDLLDISRIDSGRLTLDMESISIFELLTESVEGLKQTAESKNIHIRLQAVPTLPKVWGDDNRLQQVVDNLIANAIKFSGNDGTVSVMADEVDDMVEVSVQDTGPGLSKEACDKVFEKFYQVDASISRSVGGAGLGLAIAYGIVNMHGGKIWVESVPGKGSTFKFQIPKPNARQQAA